MADNVGKRSWGEKENTVIISLKIHNFLRRGLPSFKRQVNSERQLTGGPPYAIIYQSRNGRSAANGPFASLEGRLRAAKMLG